MGRAEGSIGGEESPDEFGAGVHVVSESLDEFEETSAPHHRIPAGILIRLENQVGFSVRLGKSVRV